MAYPTLQPAPEAVTLYLDISERLVESYGEHVKPEYVVWDSWDSCDPAEWTPYDVACELLASSAWTHYTRSDLVAMATWRYSRFDLTMDEHFQSNMAELYLYAIFDHPTRRSMGLKTIGIEDGYLKVKLFKIGG